ncbi:hypothetical protein Tco_0888350 [Tanacetum coccineum]
MPMEASGPGFGGGEGDVLDYIFLASRLRYVGLHVKLFRHVFIIAYGPTFDDALCVFNTTTETGPSSTPSEIDTPNSWDIYISQDHTSVGLAGGSNFWFETDYERVTKIILSKHTMKVKESLNVTFDESPPTKLSPLADDDGGEEEVVENQVELDNNIENGTLEDDVVDNIKESKSHSLDKVIGNLNERTLRLQAQNKSNFFCFISIIEPKNVNEALKDESWVVAIQDKLNQFVVNEVWD